MLLAVSMVAALAACGGTEEAAPAEESTEEGGEESSGGYHFEIVSKGFQHEYWQAVLKGAEKKAEELGVTINFVGPNTESDIADQLQMLNSAVNAQPDGIGFAALDTEAALDTIQLAVDAGVPIVGFDSGVPNAPEGSIYANVATDNYAAGALAAEETYALVADRIASATEPVRIGVLSQDATSESVVQRGLGFIDKFAELVEAEGKTTNVEGNERFISDSKAEKTDGADVVFDVLVPATVEAAPSQTDCETLMNKEDTIAIYGSNQHSGEAMVNANSKLQKFGTGEDQIIATTFDSGKVIKGGISDGSISGAITQAPVAMGEALVQTLFDIAEGKEVSDLDTGSQWYTAETMEDPEIAQNLYD